VDNLNSDAHSDTTMDDVPVIEAELRIGGALIKLGPYDWSPSLQRNQRGMPKKQAAKP
jgi:hypothetical protein